MSYTLGELLKDVYVALDQSEVPKENEESYYPLIVMIEMVNAGLRALGDIPLVESVPLKKNKEKGQMCFTWEKRPPVMIDYQDNFNDTWVRVYDWEYIPLSEGVVNSVVFSNIFNSSDIRVWYVDSHPRLDFIDDTISKSIEPELAISAVVERALRWQNSRIGGGEAHLMQRWQDAKLDLERARIHYQIWKPKRGQKLNLSGVLG